MTAESSPDAVLRADYGRFNPRFVGVSLFFDSPEDYELVQTAMTTPRQLAAPGPAGASLHEIALLSVIEHEQRHYLDFLLSPYSTTVFRMRLQALVNGVQALACVRELAGDVLPVPLTRWMTMPTAKRRAHEQDWSELFGGDVRAVPLQSRNPSDLTTNLASGETQIDPQGLSEEFEAYAEGAVRAYLRIGQLTEGFDVPTSVKHLRPPYIHEASALPPQLAAILVGQGTLEFARFASFLLDSQAPQARAWQQCYQLARLLSSDYEASSDMESMFLEPLRRIPSITTWALFGNHQLDGAAGCPTSRLSRLLIAIAGAPGDPRWACDMDDSASIDRLWGRWDEATGVRPWAEALAHNIALTRSAPDQYERLRAAYTGSFEIDPVIALLHQVVDHQQVALGALSRDLRQIVDPFRYVQRPAGDVPRSDVRFEFRGFGVNPAWVKSGRAINRQDASGAEITIGVAFAGCKADAEPGALLDQKLFLEAAMEWCDLAFSELAVPDHIYPSARRGIEEFTGKRIVQLV